MRIESDNALLTVHLSGVCFNHSQLTMVERDGEKHPSISVMMDLNSTCKSDDEVIPCSVIAWDDDAIKLSKKEKDDTIEILAMPIPAGEKEAADVPAFQAVHVISKYTDASHYSQETYRALFCGNGSQPELLNTINFSATTTEEVACKKISFGKETLSYAYTVVDLDSAAKEKGQVIPCRVVAWDTEAIRLSHLKPGTKFGFLAEPIAMRQKGSRDTLGFRITNIQTDRRDSISKECFIRLFDC